MEKKVFDTVFGEVIVNSVMIDINGTDLVEGLNFQIEGEFVGETTSLSIEDVTENNIEELIETYCDKV